LTLSFKLALALAQAGTASLLAERSKDSRGMTQVADEILLKTDHDRRRERPVAQSAPSLKAGGGVMGDAKGSFRRRDCRSRVRVSVLGIIGLTALVSPGTLSCSSTGEERVGIAREGVETVVTRAFQNGVSPTATYDGCVDTTIWMDQPTMNSGNDTMLIVDGNGDNSGFARSTLIKWDISSIPFGSRVESARIILNVHSVTADTYVVAEMLRSWSESTATWQRATLVTLWGYPGARAASDRGADIGTIGPVTAGDQSIPFNAAGVSMVQSWIDGSRVNRGIIIAKHANTDDLTFASSELSTPSVRPMLVISYVSFGCHILPNAGGMQSCGGSAGSAGANSAGVGASRGGTGGT
jgi:hypothetical protein